MKPNLVKRKLAEGQVSIGTFVFEFDTTGIARIASESGAEFAIFDMEHTGWGTETIRMLIATSRSTELIPMVRIPATEYHFIARVLDMGAMGLMVPMVETEEQARRIVRSAKYPPAGVRGAAFGVAHDDYTGGDIVPKIESANREQLLIAQIETARGLENVEAIAAVEGIDVLWVGHFDLTNSLGIPGQFSHPTFLQAIGRVVEVCRAHGKIPGFLASDVANGKALLDLGYRILAYGGDLWIYQQALRQGIAALGEFRERVVRSQ
jgi:2-dehydro-3-deoxyglucarate aldolase/4-hydroxy-2-oxoheptanedioate aldolase